MIDFNKQGSGNSIKSLNLSDEAIGSSLKGPAVSGAKSAFSDTVSNPDLDEYFFNKHTGDAGTSMSKKVNLNELKLQRQQSPNENAAIFQAAILKQPDNSPGTGANKTGNWPFKKSSSH